MAENKKPDFETPPSEHMVVAFAVGGTAVMDCDFCGRTHFANDETAVAVHGAEDLERLLQKQREHPDKFFSVNHDSVRYCDVGGQHWVDGCPCNAITRYENFLWNYRHEIASYLKARAEAEFNSAKFAHALVGELPAFLANREV